MNAFFVIPSEVDKSLDTSHIKMSRDLSSSLEMTTEK
jgi:hypothetical protein